MATVTAPEGWRVEDGAVRLSDVGKTAQCPYSTIQWAARSGLIEVERQGGQGNARWVRVEDALLIVAVAALAVAAGLAFASLLKAVKDSGARVSPEGLTIPMPTRP